MSAERRDGAGIRQGRSARCGSSPRGEVRSARTREGRPLACHSPRRTGRRRGLVSSPVECQRTTPHFCEVRDLLSWNNVRRSDPEIHRARCAQRPEVRLRPRSSDVGSPGAGRGGFAARSLKRGDTISNYITATVKQSPAEFKASFSDGRKPTHSARVGQFYYTALGTGKRTHSAVGLINRASSGARNNARILGSGRVVATRRIPRDEEIFLAYGVSYRI